MKVLLINPMLAMLSNRDLEYPLHLVYLASGLKEASPGTETTILDIPFEYCDKKMRRLPPAKAQERCVDSVFRKRGPFDLVGLGGFCDNFHLSVRLAEYIKRRYGSRIVMGGPHATFVAENIIRDFPFVDFVIRNDGITPLTRLCAALNGLDFREVPSLTYREPGSGAARSTPTQSSGPDVTTIEPDYGLVDFGGYRRINPACLMLVLAGTGCPYKCSYCSTSLMWERKYRVLPPAVIAGRMQSLAAKFPGARFSLVHDNLLCDREFAVKLCSELEGKALSWGASGRLEHLFGDRGLMDGMKKAGCIGLFVGIESGSRRIQHSIGKNVDVKKVLPLASDLIASGLNPVFSFILGFPQESDSDRNASVRLAFRLRVMGAERVNILHLFPLPGTEIAERTRKVSAKNSYYTPPLIASDGKTRGMIHGHPEIFRQFWALKDRPGRSLLLPHATWRLQELAVGHYRSFNYLFSVPGLPPAAVFPVLSGRAWKPGLTACIRKKLKPSEFLVFREIFRYEKLLLKMVKARGTAAPRKARPFDVGRPYRLSGKAFLLESRIRLSDYLGPGPLPERPRPGRTLLCLVDTGEDIESFELEPRLFKALKAAKRRPARPGDMPREEGLGGKEDLIRHLNDLADMGAISNV